MSLTEPFRVTVALHSEKETAECEIVSAIGDRLYQELSDEVQRKLRYMLYEVIFEIEADPRTGKYKILSISDGDDVFVPQE